MPTRDSETLNPDDLSLSPEELESRLSGPEAPPPRHRKGTRFLKGPVPWEWLEVAGQLPGKALVVALMLWREAGCSGRRTVSLNQSQIGMGVDRYAARRGILALESAGLVKTEHHNGAALRVTLLDAPTPTERT